MQLTHVLAIVLLPILSCSAGPISNGLTTENKGFRLPLRRNVLQNTERLSGRSVPVELTNRKVNYVIDLTIGSPPQTVQIGLDTGSSEVWVFSPEACSTCGGAYEPTLSRTVEAVNNIGSFSQAYADGTSAKGYYVTDKIVLGDTEVTEVYLGVATSGKSSMGNLGIGYDGEQTSSAKHPGILDTLLDQKLISSKSYSIFLNDVTAGTGSIVFGGIDNSRYSGFIRTLPIIQTDKAGNGPGLNIEWTSLVITNSSGAHATLTAPDLSIPVLLDTGSTGTTVPYTIYWQLYKYFGATGPDNGFVYVSCDMPDGYLRFGFGPGSFVTIDVPFSELAIPMGDKCWFGLQPQPQDGLSITFGDTFLRSAYVYFDFDKNEIGLAQSIWD